MEGTFTNVQTHKDEHRQIQRNVHSYKTQTLIPTKKTEKQRNIDSHLQVQTDRRTMEKDTCKQTHADMNKYEH